MPWATPSHTSGPPESPCGQREQELSSASSGLVFLPPWGGWSLLGVLADIRVLLVPRFHPGIDNPAAPPAGSPCPFVTVEQCSPPRGTGQRPDRRTGCGHRDGVRSHSPCPHSSLGPGFYTDNTGDLTEKELFLLFGSPAHICMMGM